jgi:hypothetical protein
MAKKPSPTPERIPEFASFEEDAAFWDTHSTADYEAEFKPVRVRFAKRFSTGVTIRLVRTPSRKCAPWPRKRVLGPPP